MDKRFIIGFLIIVTVALSGVAIFIAYTLTGEDSKVGPAPANAGISTASAGSCSGNCNSGSECNGYGDPSPGKMWGCWQQGGSYGCFETDINAGGDRCFLSCSGGWQSCGCDINACRQACSQKGPGYQTHTMICAGCQQEFTCDCNNPNPTPTPTTPVNTPTPTTPVNTPTPTRPANTPTPKLTTTPTVTLTVTPTLTTTPSITPTGTIIPTPSETIVPTLPETAIFIDEKNRIIPAVLFIIMGVSAIVMSFDMKLINLARSTKSKLSETKVKRKRKTLDEFEERFDD